MEKCEVCGREVQDEMDMILDSEGNWVCHRCVVSYYQSITDRATKAFVDMNILYNQAALTMRHFREALDELPEEFLTAIKEFEDQ